MSPIRSYSIRVRVLSHLVDSKVDGVGGSLFIDCYHSRVLASNVVPEDKRLGGVLCSVLWESVSGTRTCEGSEPDY